MEINKFDSVVHSGEMVYFGGVDGYKILGEDDNYYQVSSEIGIGLEKVYGPPKTWKSDKVLFKLGKSKNPTDVRLLNPGLPISKGVKDAVNNI